METQTNKTPIPYSEMVFLLYPELDEEHIRFLMERIGNNELD